MYTTQSPTFGLLLKRHRRAAGMTQEELAERTGVSVRAISDLERGLRQPRRDTLQLLLDTLQLGADEQARLVAAASTAPSASEGAGSRGSLLQTEGSFLGALPPGPLVSRQHEVRRVLAAVDAVVGGNGRLVMLTGESGIGKTRLAQEVSLEAGRRGFLVASGRCYEPEQDVPFYPFLEVLATAYSAAPRAIRDEVPRRWPYLGWLLPEDILPVSAPARSGWMSGRGEEQRLFWAVSAFLAAIGEEMPVVVLLDDLHWADGASLKLLLHLARHTRSDRILLLGTYRDVELGPPGTPRVPLARALVDLNRERLVERVSVHRLDQEGTAELIVATIGEIKVSPEFAALIHRGTDGNPFFIQEVLRALVERGEIYQEDGHWKCRDIQEFQTPETVRAAIGERLARLHAEAQAVLYRASVLGQTFDFDDLRALGDSSEDELDEALEAAASAGLIREEGMSGYAFNHALTQHALYEDLSMRRKRSLHLAAGEALHQLPDRVREQRAAELAWHFREGGDSARAVAYTMLAGDRAVELFAYGEAERHFRMAVELVTAGDSTPADSPLGAEALAKLGRVLDLTERYDEALAALEQAAESYRMQGNVAAEALVVAEIGWLHHNRGTDEEGLARVQPVVAALEQESASSRQHRALAALYTGLARLFFGLGRYSDELAAAERAVNLAQELGDQMLLAVANARRGAAMMTVGRREEAREALEEAITLSEAAGNLGTITVALDNLGEIARDGGDYRQGQRDCERAVELAEQIGVPGRIAWTLTKLGRIHLLKGEWARARAIFERALRLLEDDPRSAAYPRIHLGQLDLLEGNWETGSARVEAAMRAEAPGRDLWLRWHGQRLLAERDLLDGRPAAALARLTPLAEQTGGRKPQGTIMFTLLFAPLAWAYLELDQEDEAEAVLTEGMARAQAQNHRLAQAELLRVQGMLRTRQGRWQEAWEVLEEAIELAQHMPDPHREAQARAVLGTLAARTGKDVEARDQLRESLAIFQRLGAHPYIRRVQRSLVQLGRV
jgi:tetratricopeptide (TPR) repeat protein/transcriptional regulator with XRE-family HTH domain